MEDMKKMDVTGIEPEGMELCDWVLLDTGDVLIHVFKPEIREMYNLEGMWSVGDVEEKVKVKRATKTKV
jgi:ribosome-associated protein